MSRLFALVSLISVSALAAPPADVKTNYVRYCASCHGFDGRGAMPNVPNLKMTNALFKPEMPMIDALKRGSERKPPFMGLLSDRDLSELINHMRTMP